MTYSDGMSFNCLFDLSLVSWIFVCRDSMSSRPLDPPIFGMLRLVQHVKVVRLSVSYKARFDIGKD